MEASSFSFPCLLGYVTYALRNVDVHVEIRLMLLHLLRLLNIIHIFFMGVFLAFPIMLMYIIERE